MRPVYTLCITSLIGNGLKKKNSAVAYLRENTVRSAIKHFISIRRESKSPVTEKTEPFYKTKRLHLELKSQFDCNRPNLKSKICRDDAIRLANEIITILPNLDDLKTDDGKNWLSLVSFSATALQAAHETLKKAGLDQYVDFSLIAGVYPFDLRWFPGQLKGSVPVFSKALQNFSVDKKWLDTIWFSPQGIKGFNELFQDIVDKRKKKHSENDRFGFNIAVYSYAPSQFITEMLATQKSKIKLPIEAMMIDVDDRPFQ